MTEESPKCAMKGCENERFKGKLFCEKHWKSRRKEKSYKDRWEND